MTKQFFKFLCVLIGLTTLNLHAQAQTVTVLFYNGFSDTISLGEVVNQGTSVQIRTKLDSDFELPLQVTVGSQWVAMDKNNNILGKYKVGTEADQAYDFLPAEVVESKTTDSRVVPEASSQTSPVSQPERGDNATKAEPTSLRGLVTDGSYYWVLNGDGSRNWLQSTPACKSDARRMARADIDALFKRHEGSGGYTLQGSDINNICNAPTGVEPKIFTNGGYFWILNSDGSRNWISSPTDECRKKAQSQNNIDQFPKRHGGNNGRGYQLKGLDSSVACALSAGSLASSPVTSDGARKGPISFVNDPEFQAWVNTEVPRRSKKPAASAWERSNFPLLGALGDLERGINVFKVDGAFPSTRDYLTEHVRIFDSNLEEGSKDYHRWSNTFNLPHWVDFQPITLTAGSEIELLTFSSEERRKSKSLSISLGVGTPKGTAEVGVSNTETSTRSNTSGQVYSYSERWGAWGQLSLDKRYLKGALSDEFIERVGEINENDQGSFEKFFDAVGTHYVIRAIMGGKTFSEGLVETSEVVESFEKESSKSASANVPIKAASVNGSIESSTSESDTSSDKTEDTLRESGSYGGTIGADDEEWMIDTNNLHEVLMLTADLRPISDLIWPELLGAKSMADAQRINRLRKKMAQAYERQREKVTAKIQQEQLWAPRLFRVKIDHLKALAVNDTEAFYDEKPEISGSGQISMNGVFETFLSISEDDEQEVEAEQKLRLEEDEFSWVVLPKAISDGRGGTKPSFADNRLMVMATLIDNDHTSTEVLPPFVHDVDLGASARGYYADGKQILLKKSSPSIGEFELGFTITEGEIEFQQQPPEYPSFRPF